jgi:hypothetical protein
MNRNKVWASSAESLVVGDQKVAIKHIRYLEIAPTTFWNTNNGGENLTNLTNLTNLINLTTILISINFN